MPTTTRPTDIAFITDNPVIEGFKDAQGLAQRDEELTHARQQNAFDQAANPSRLRQLTLNNDKSALDLSTATQTQPYDVSIRQSQARTGASNAGVTEATAPDRIAEAHNATRLGSVSANVAEQTQPDKVEAAKLQNGVTRSSIVNSQLASFGKINERLDAGDVYGAKEAARIAGINLSDDQISDSQYRETLKAAVDYYSKIYAGQPRNLQAAVQGQIDKLTKQRAAATPVAQPPTSPPPRNLSTVAPVPSPPTYQNRPDLMAPGDGGQPLNMQMPQRPANVPDGASYAPGQQTWHSPDGRDFDAQGNPVTRTAQANPVAAPPLSGPAAASAAVSAGVLQAQQPASNVPATPAQNLPSFADRFTLPPGAPQPLDSTDKPIAVPYGSTVVDHRGVTLRPPDTSALLDDKTIDAMAHQLKAGDTSVLTNLGRGAQGAQNIVAVRKRLAELNAAEGVSGSDQAMRNAEFFGTKAGQRTVGTKSANIELAATEFRQVLPIVMAASKAVDRTQFPDLNQIIQAFEERTGDPNIVKFGGGVNTLVNLYARAISPSGVPTVSDKDHARILLNKAWAQGQFEAAAGMMQQEIDAAMNSPEKVRDAMRRRFSDGNTPSNAPASQPNDQPATGQGSTLPPGVTPDQALSEARQAIAAGKDRNVVIQRLRQWRIDPTGL